MKTIKCDRLLVNDTGIDDSDIQVLIEPYVEEYNLSLENGFILGKLVESDVEEFIKRSDQILIPGGSASIFLNCTGVEIPEDKKVLLPSIRRKLQGLTPRGISISDEDLDTLNFLEGERIGIIDDVIASGTTINGLTKRAKKKNTEVYTLISRAANDLRRDIKGGVLSACSVESVSEGRAAINTLSSISDSIKGPRILQTFSSTYGKDFAKRIESLFTN